MRSAPRNLNKLILTNKPFLPRKVLVFNEAVVAELFGLIDVDHALGVGLVIVKEILQQVLQIVLHQTKHACPDFRPFHAAVIQVLLAREP